MAKLGVQLSEEKQQQGSQRVSRTERVGLIQKRESDQRKFKALSEKADKVREEKFAGVSAEEYGGVYDTLDADIKPFFSTGAEVLQQKADSIADTRSQVQQQISEAKAKLIERKAYYERKEQRTKESWKKRSSDYRSKEKNRDRYDDRRNDIDNDWEEDEAKYRGRIKGYEKGLQQLNANKDVDFKSLKNYAHDVGSYEEDREEARNDNRDNFNKSKRSGELDETFKQLKLDKSKTSYSEFKKEIKDFNKDVAYKQNLVKWADRVGFDKISPQAQAILNPSAVAWQKANPTEKLIYDGVNVAGVESGNLKQSMSIGNYQKVTSPEYIYDQWKKKNPAPKITPVYDFKSGGFQSKDLNPFSNIKPNKIDANFKVLTAGKELSYDYGSQQTAQFDGMGNIIPASQVISKADYNRIKANTSSPIKDLWKGAKWVDNRVHWDFGTLGGSPSMPKLNVVSFGLKDEPTLAERKINQASNFLGDQKQSVEEWVLGKDKIDKFGADLETQYQGKYQYQFEQKYMKDLIFNETDFETASGEFKESAEAKALQKQFEKDYGAGYKDLQTVTNNPLKEDFWRGRVVGGVANTGLSLGQLGLGVVKTPTRVAGAGAVVYSGGAVLGAVPTAVSLGLSGGLFAYGSYKFLDPSSTYIEAGGGLVTSVIAGATLGYAGVKYLKSPVVKRVAIKPPKATLKSSSVIGKDIKIIKDGVETNKVIYQSQKLSQVGKAGSRTIVTTKGRVLSNKFWKELGVPAKFRSLDSNAIYRGIPTEQLGKAYTVQSLRGSTNIVIGKSGYKKASDLLQKYGWSNAQAKATLRYTAPRVYESYLNKGIITVKGAKATAYFEHLVKRPVINVNSNLGIKTRGGATLKDITKIQRQLVKDASGNTFSKYSGIRGSGFVDKAGKFKDWKEVELLSGKTYVKSFDRKGFEYLGKQGGIDAWKSDQAYKDLFSFSRKDALKLKITKTRANLNVDLNYNPLRNLEGSNAKLYNQIIDLDKGKNVWIKPANIKKTPFSKTFGLDQADDVAFKFTKDPSKSSSNIVEKIMNKIDKVDDFKPTGQQSKFYGQGQYEQSFGGGSPNKALQDQLIKIDHLKLSPHELLKSQQLLKSPIDAQLIKVGSLVKTDVLVKHLELGKLLTIGQVAGLSASLHMKATPQLKVGLKADYKLKQLLKEDMMIKTAQIPAMKTSPALKTQLKSILDLDLGSPLTNSPAFKTPTIPKIKSPTIPKPFVIPFLKAKIKKGSAGKGAKKITDLAYLPDFTSRALGLNPQAISQKQAQAKLKKLLTGLEIRRGVKIK